MRIAMPATSDYWVNDRDGEPLFVLTAEANAGMVRMLLPLLVNACTPGMCSNKIDNSSIGSPSGS